MIPHQKRVGNTDLVSPDPSGLPIYLQTLPQWVCWILHPRGNGKPAKKPFNPITGKPANVNDPQTWAGFDDAMRTYQRRDYAGVGFVLTQSTGITAVDLDGVRNPDSGELSSQALKIVGELDTFTEISPSGTGLHLFATGRLDPSGPNRRNGIELYDKARFIAVTGQRIPGTPHTVEHRESLLRSLQDQLRSSKSVKNGQPPNDSQSAQVGTMMIGQTSEFEGSDSELLSGAFNAKNGRLIYAYWTGEWRGKPSASEALLALAQLLAFYTGPDEDRLERLLIQSPLFFATEGMRAKWNSPRPGGTWGRVYVVRKAISTCSKFYVKRSVLFSEITPPTTCVSNGRQFRGVLRGAWERVQADEMPEGIERIKSRHGQENKRKLIALCWHLAGRRINGRFFLSSIDAAKLLGVDQTTVSRWLTSFVTAKLIHRIRLGSGLSGNASEYLYVGGMV